MPKGFYVKNKQVLDENNNEKKNCSAFYRFTMFLLCLFDSSTDTYNGQSKYTDFDVVIGYEIIKFGLERITNIEGSIEIKSIQIERNKNDPMKNRHQFQCAGQTNERSVFTCN